MSKNAALLPRISVTRPVTVTMCLVALLVIGAVAYSQIRLQAFPSGWEWKYLWVWVRARDSSPKENDQQICRLFEEYFDAILEGEEAGNGDGQPSKEQTDDEA